YHLILFYLSLVYIILLSFPTRRSSYLLLPGAGALQTWRRHSHLTTARVDARSGGSDAPAGRTRRGTQLVHVSGRNLGRQALAPPDRKSTRLNSSHVKISYAVFCLKKKI